MKHRIAIAYHPQPNELAELSNHEIKIILEKTVDPARKDWSLRIDEALWDHKTTFKALLVMSLYRIVYGKACHLSLALENKAYSTIKKLNMSIEVVK